MMTTNYTHIINDNLDMFDIMTNDNSVENAVVSRDVIFTIINPIDFNGCIDGLCNAWRIEYTRDGIVELGQNNFSYGYIEDDKIAMDGIFWAQRNGWEPTGRVFFNGYFEEAIEFCEEDGKYETVYRRA